MDIIQDGCHISQAHVQCYIGKSLCHLLILQHMMLVYLFARSSKRIWVTILEASSKKKKKNDISNTNDVKSCKFIVKISMIITSSRCWAIKDYLFEERFALTQHTVLFPFLMRKQAFQKKMNFCLLCSPLHITSVLKWIKPIQNWHDQKTYKTDTENNTWISLDYNIYISLIFRVSDVLN